MARRFAELADRFDELTAEALRQVAQWRSSRSGSHWDDPAPLAAERHGERRGRLVKPPTDGDWAWRDEIGLDATGQCVIVRSHKADGQVNDVTVMLRRSSRLETARFYFDSLVGREWWKLSGIGWIEHDGEDKPVCTYRYWEWNDYDADAHEYRLRAGFSVERYEYDDAGRIADAEKRQYLAFEDDTGPWPDMWASGQRLRAVYDHAGRLQAVDSSATWVPPEALADGFAKARTWRVWRAPADRTQIKRWRTAVETHLVQAVKQRVNATGAREVAAVALLYSDQQVLPPVIGVLLASERDGFVAEYGDYSGAYVWNPAEWSILDDSAALRIGADPAIAQAVAELNLEDQASRSHQPSRRLLNRVAKQLNETDWAAATTADFIVFATDTEQAELLSNLRATIPVRLLHHHRRQAWSPG